MSIIIIMGNEHVHRLLLFVLQPFFSWLFHKNPKCWKQIGMNYRIKNKYMDHTVCNGLFSILEEAIQLIPHTRIFFFVPIRSAIWFWLKNGATHGQCIVGKLTTLLHTMELILLRISGKFVQQAENYLNAYEDREVCLRGNHIFGWNDRTDLFNSFIFLIFRFENSGNRKPLCATGILFQFYFIWTKFNI